MPVLPTGWRGSTALNSKITSYADLAERIKLQLGFPVTDLELTDQQIASFIDEALEWFTQYSGRETKYLMFCDDAYVEGCGVKLDDVIRHASIVSECMISTSAVEVTGVDITYETISTESAYVSVGCFKFPTEITSNLNLTTSVNANTGQKVVFKFDRLDPWDSAELCNADCVVVRPTGSQWFDLSSNSNLSAIDFTDLIITYPELSGLLDNPVVSADGDGIVDIIELPQSVLSAIPIEYFPVSAFYDDIVNVGFPVSGCVEISNGVGVVYPNCDRSLVDSCSPASAVWVIDTESFSYIPLDSAQVPYIYLDSLSATLTGCADPCLSAPLLSSVADGIILNVLSTIPYLSGESGIIISPYDIDLSSATHVRIAGLPICAIDDTIPLTENTGIYATFCICNSAIDTEGGYSVSNIQFLKDYKVPADLANQQLCDITNTGFNIKYNITTNADCLKKTPTWVPVDLEFQTKVEEDAYGTVVTTVSSGYDDELNYRRKVIDVFGMDYTLGHGGTYGSNLLFSFNHGVVANAFGFDLQGNRSFNRNGYDMLSYHMARGFIDKVRKMVNYISYSFNEDTQYLTLIPEPYPVDKDGGRKRCYVVGAYVEKPLQELINKKWVQEWVKMRMIQSLGYIRSKFGTVELYGGASIQGESLIATAQTMEERLLRELRDDLYYTEPPLFFVG